MERFARGSCYTTSNNSEVKMASNVAANKLFEDCAELLLDDSRQLKVAYLQVIITRKIRVFDLFSSAYKYESISERREFVSDVSVILNSNTLSHAFPTNQNETPSFFFRQWNQQFHSFINKKTSQFQTE
jgi:hypothetical protein